LAVNGEKAMDEITRIRGKITHEVFDYQALVVALSGYSKPRDKITKLLATGSIIRIKKGLYCFGEALRKEPVSREQVANLIYGPSYVSIEYALGYHGLIPERVEVVTSVTTRRSRRFTTPLGVFTYSTLRESRYAVGAILKSAGKASFLIATPEKALADKVWTDKRFSGSNTGELASYLLDDLRIDEKDLSLLSTSRLEVVRRAYRSSKIDRLVRYVERLGRPSNA
jgi:predicted transcriptional regulator of viral defense system